MLRPNSGFLWLCIPKQNYKNSGKFNVCLACHPLCMYFMATLKINSLIKSFIFYVDFLGKLLITTLARPVQIVNYLLLYGCTTRFGFYKIAL